MAERAVVELAPFRWEVTSGGVKLDNGGTMRRFGGVPYSDGERWRCPDCNGLVAFKNSHYDGSNLRQHYVRVGICQTCGARGPHPHGSRG